MNPKSTPLARGKRLKSLRKMAYLSRRDMTEKYQIPSSTLQDWEAGRYSGLSVKGAKKVLTALNQEGIQCALDWLMEGAGVNPTLSEKLFDNTESLVTTNDNLNQFSEEIALFHKRIPSAIDFCIDDDGMEPRFMVGEHVAGSARSGEKLHNLINQDCIIQLQQGNYLVRRLLASSQKNRFNLYCINPNTTVNEPMLYDIEILRAAPIIWQRRQDNNPL